MVRSVDHQICFRLADALPAASLLELLRLGDPQAEAMSELLQGFRLRGGIGVARLRASRKFAPRGDRTPGTGVRRGRGAHS